MTTYVKFINLFPEIKTNIQDILSQDSNLKSADAELQQRASEYLQLSKVTSLDVLATVLEEMPPFPEKESSGLLNLLKKKRPGRVPENPEIKLGDSANDEDGTKKGAKLDLGSAGGVGGGGGGATDLLGLGLDSSVNGNGTLGGGEAPTDNLKKYEKVF